MIGCVAILKQSGPRQTRPFSRTGRTSSRAVKLLSHGSTRVVAIEFTLNGKTVTLDAAPDMPLLWALRDMAGLTGTKFGCGMGLCGCCTVHLEGHPVRACVTPLAAIQGRSITTVEGVGADPIGRAVQAAWLELGVPQCGYCQAGQIMSATALLHEKAHPTDIDIEQAMAGNLCRCGTYLRIRAAIKHAAASIVADAGSTISSTISGAV